jgi:FdhD protein
VSTTIWKIKRWKEGAFTRCDDEVVEELPLTIFANGKEIVTLLTLGENPAELAVGFLRSEGFLSAREDILELKEEEGIVRLTLKGDLSLVESLLERRTLTTGCGKGTTFYHPLDALRVKPLDTEAVFSPEEILARMGEVQTRSEVFQRTGGTHNASLASPEKTLLFRADIGRHNAVDMLGGRALLDGLDMGNLALFTTGRVSSEILLKTAKMGVAVLVSRSAPTALALRLGEQLGMTVVGYVRGGRFNVYTNPQRVG